MHYSFTRQPTHGIEEKAFRWKDVELWDAKWQTLSPAARRAFVEKVRTPAAPGKSNPVSIRPDELLSVIREELLAAGFIESRRNHLTPVKERLVVPDQVIPFSKRIRAMVRFGLTTLEGAVKLKNYCDQQFVKPLLLARFSEVAQHAGKNLFGLPELQIYEKYILRARWIDWVAPFLKNDVVNRVLERVSAAEAPLTRAELTASLPGVAPEKIESAVRTLVAHLALFEDVRPKTWEIVVGLQPLVRADRLKASIVRVRPPLVECAPPPEIAPTGGVLLDDLRVLLLELADQPARTKVDGSCYQKEEDRLIAVMPQWPEWLSNFLLRKPFHRFHDILKWALQLQMVSRFMDHNQDRWIRLTPRGTKWLSSPLEEQYALLYQLLSSFPDDKELTYGGSPLPESTFLGCDAAVRIVDPKPQYYNSWGVPKERRVALRNALHQAWSKLKPGEFYLLDSVLQHLSFAENNPLLTDEAPEKVHIIVDGRVVRDMEEELEPNCKAFLLRHIKERLIPLGCMSLAIQERGAFCVARNPRLDVYYGKAVMTSNLAQEAGPSAKVVVQPDFSIIIIGMNPAPAVELAPFCERIKGHAGQGSITLRISRDSVLKAVTQGLSSKEILQRLKKHASNALPKNVLHEVTEWSAWVRAVTPKEMIVIRCPDRETADRVMSALSKHAERLGNTIVGLEKESLNAADRNALKKYGVVVVDAQAPQVEAQEAEEDEHALDDWEEVQDEDLF